MKKKSNYRLISALLAIIMVFGMTPVLAAAERTEEESLLNGTSSEIIAFESLVPDVSNRIVALGTNEESLNLPDRLTATVTVHRVSWATPSNGTSEDIQDLEEELQVSVPVNWISQPEYNGNVADEYVFSPTVSGYILADHIQLPSILVQVNDGIEDNGIFPVNGISPLNLWTEDTMNIYAAQSFTLETSRTEMFDQSEPGNFADYTNNVIYYPDTEDTLTGTYVAGISGATSSSGQATIILRFPADGKLLLGGAPQLTVYHSNNREWPWYLITPENVLTEEYLSGAGVESAILYSSDGGENFSEVLQPDTDAIGLRIAVNDGALQSLISAEKYLCMKVEFPVSVNKELLTQDEASGTTPLKGWKSLHSSGTINIGSNIYLSSPEISGTIRRQEFSGGGTLNWTSADTLNGQTVELLSGDTVIDTTVTNENGEYTFSNISTLEKLQVRVKVADGTVYVADAAAEVFQQADSVPVGSITDIDRVLGRFSNLNIIWKESAGIADADALNHQNVKFIVVAPDLSNPAATYTVTFDCQEGSAISALTGIPSGSTIAAPENPFRAGYRFAGWFKEAACSNVWNYGSDTVTCDTTLYAKWIPAGSSDSHNSGDSSSSNNSSGSGGSNSSSGSSHPGNPSSPGGSTGNGSNSVETGGQPDDLPDDLINSSSLSPTPASGDSDGNMPEGLPRTGERNTGLIWWVLSGISLVILSIQVIFISRN